MIDDQIDLAGFKLGIDPMCEQGVVGFIFKVHDIFRVTRYLDTLDVFVIDNLYAYAPLNKGMI